MIYLDTHIVLWLYGDQARKIPAEIRRLINSNDLLISPMVALELTYLREIGRLNDLSEVILADLAARIGLSVCTEPFSDVVTAAAGQVWTRDPFDRIIVGQAALRQRKLVTMDRHIRAHFPLAIWSDED